MRFGDSPEKLGDARKCKRTFLYSEVYTSENQTIGCTREKQYGSIVSIPIYDVEYIFNKINGEQKLTNIKIYLNKSPELVESEYRKLLPKGLPESFGEVPNSEDTKSIMDLAYRLSTACETKAEKFDDAWGRFFKKTSTSPPAWDGKRVSAYLGGRMCNELNIKSVELEELENHIKKKKVKSRIIEDF